MKIIERGTKPRGIWQGHFRCPYCRTLYEIGDDDVVLKRHDDQMDGVSVQVNCPVCGQVRWLSKEGDWHGPRESQQDVGYS